MPRKILIVDDNAINRQMLINVLGKDYDIIEAENGIEALAQMHRNYKLLSAVLLDIMMPEMDGYEVLRRTRENAALAQIPIIMITGAEDEESRVKVLSLGANDFMLKPFNPDIVKHCLRNNIALRETSSILNAIQKDKLTGLYNREAFFEKAGAMIKNSPAGSYILSCFDIDNFKLINDQYGAAEGDRILREIGNTIRFTVEGMGGLAGRISGDNFAALLPVEKKDTDVLQRLQDRILVMLEQRSIVFSTGRYLISDTSLSASAIYDRAYIAKQSVKGRYDKHMAYFDEAMLEKLVRAQQIVGDMEKALSERQFEVWFQPQYNSDTGALTGAEALVRWRHPQHGLVPPGEFIPLFEQNGFVYELDKYVWRESCRYLRKWLDEGLMPMPVSVNISRYDIFRADLMDTITGIVREYGIPIELLRLEITESAFAQSTELIVDIVKRLVDIGFTVEIDDFGSGYSSLNTLKSVPAQVVKLDMRFLEDGDDAQRGGNILESIVRMTKWLGMSVIAEGVETREQGDFLKSIGCSQVQGYLYARPMPAESYEEHFRETKTERLRSALKTADNLDNNSFWNPSSMDSIIFNSFVGSACIYEYCAGEIELVRVTDKYANMLGGSGMTAEKLMKLDLMKYLDKESTKETIQKVNASVELKGETTGEFLFIDLPGCPHETYIRSTMRVIASVDNRYLIYCISENITAQRMAERMGRKTEKQLQVVMDNISCGITAGTGSAERMEYLLANDKYYELMGYTREQYITKGVTGTLSLVHPEDRQRVAETVAHTGRTGIPASTEYRIVRRDGSIAWIRSALSMTDFDDVEGKVQLSTYVDITAERHMSQDLLDNLPCGAGICVVTENDAVMTYLNRRYLSYFRHNRGASRTDSVFSALHPDDRAVLRAAMRPALSRGGEGSCVVRIQDGPDEYIPFRLTGRALEWGDGQNIIYVTFVPISHETFSFSEMLPVALEKMMESSTELSFVKDKDLRYICCSRSFAQLVGLQDEKEVYGKTDRDLFAPEYADKYIADDLRMIESGNAIVDMVESIPSADGRTSFACTSKYLLNNSRGDVIGIYGAGRNITRTREAEEQQRFLINNIPGGVAIYEGEWSTLESIKLTWFSDGFCKLFGYTREEYEALGSKNPIGLVAAEYIPGFVKQIEALVKTGSPIDYIYRAHGKDDIYRWIHVKALPGEKNGDNMTVNAVLFDVTEHQEALERLRVSEEENRLALRHSKNVVCRYDVKKRVLSISTDIDPIFVLGTTVSDVPYGQVKSGMISPETAGAYTEFYEKIMRGEKGGSTVFQRNSAKGWRWVEAHSSTICSGEGEPVAAVISFIDVTENFEKDVAYTKRTQTMHNKDKSSYSLFRCNVSKKTFFDTAEGMLLNMEFDRGQFDFDARTAKYAAQCVMDEDTDRFRAFLSVDSLLQKYYRGERSIALEYREKQPADGGRWIRLTVDLVEYPHSSDVEAYILFEDIDELKRNELLTLERAQTDPLTGLLNRTTFAEKVNALIRGGAPDTKHALLMMDIDGFKLVNDVFGHGAGDEALVDIATLLRGIMRRGDLVGRLGGDEFVVFLNDIPDDRIAMNKAEKICELTRKAFSAEVHISGSVGIAMYPADGADFDALYKKADQTLYYVKGSGRDNYAFYRKDMAAAGEHTHTADGAPAPAKTTVLGAKKRRMLIVDDSRIDYEMLANMFRSEYIVENARDGNAALIRMRHYGTAISVVLLDLMMPGMDGFAVLEKMQQSPDMHSIPVIVVSGDNERETSLKAIRGGASDFVMKPVDADVLRIRVQSAVSKAENERLRAKNSYLELISAESARYQTVFDRIGLGVMEMDWGKGTFTYSPSVSDRIAGKFDSRSLWHILMSDLVADAGTVKDIQQFVHDVAADRDKTEGSMTAVLKTPGGRRHSFIITVYKQQNEFGLTDKLLITFKDTGAKTDTKAGE